MSLGGHAALRSPDAVPPEGGWAEGQVMFASATFVLSLLQWTTCECKWFVFGREGECLGSMLGLKKKKISHACLPILVITGRWVEFGGALSQ